MKPSREELDEMYWGNKMSTTKIGYDIGVSGRTVLYWMKEYGIESRTISESKLGDLTKPSKSKLEEMYFSKKMSLDEIAQEIGVSSGTITKWMQSFEIEKRTRSESQLVDSKKPSASELEEMYRSKKMSTTEIAQELDVHYSTVSSWLQEFEIEIRTSSESLKGKYIGENASQWQGGISFEPYCEKFNNEFKESVRKRDDYICQLCGYEQKLGSQKLDVHHIHYDKENCYPDVVALCRSCNIKVNGNRDYWERHFEDLLIEQGHLYWSVSKIIGS